MPPEQETTIDKPQARALIEAAHGLWISARTYVFSHQEERRRKKYWFDQLARTAFVASLITVGISTFGFASNGTAVVWLLTGLAGTLAAAAKLGEQLIGKPEDIQSHLHAALVLQEKMYGLTQLVAKALGYYEGTQLHDLQELLKERDVLSVAINEASESPHVLTTIAHEKAAADAIKGTSIDIDFGRVRNPGDQDDDPKIQRAVRGG